MRLSFQARPVNRNILGTPRGREIDRTLIRIAALLDIFVSAKIQLLPTGMNSHVLHGHRN
jgi:hypothetical protein